MSPVAERATCLPALEEQPASTGASPRCMLPGLQGTHLASGAGDSTVKLWSFEKQKCVATYSDHTQAVWGVAFHDSGNFVASCSLDHSVRLWDVTTGKCRQSMRCVAVCFSGGASMRLWDVDHRQVPAELKAVLGTCLQQPELHSASVGPPKWQMQAYHNISTSRRLSSSKLCQC